MSHQIYYTSAPEGLKRGSSGFSTVAASDNIPKQLWDRLEALSAYRHHFPANSSGQNPVSFAHWLLNVSGTTYHVLSRICDSGVDHTQRTNAFAHHLLLENSEMPAAGPAWLLERGVMAEAWNGAVGNIPPKSIPRGETAPAICHAWQAATGDAGWGGHLADIFIKSPTKPVCILFSPGQEILPLIAETIALLPAAVRWNVTFNTYFTSMPTSATCVWRCCLAETPAAQIGLRYAAGGVVIDLTDKSRLGQVPPGPYVTLARTGQSPAIRTTAATAAKSARPSAATPVRVPPIRSTATPATGEQEPLPEEPSFAELDAQLTGTLAAPLEFATATPTLAPSSRSLTARTGPSLIKSADAALKSAEQEAASAAARRRRQVMTLFIAALAALGLGTILFVYVMNNSHPPDLKPNTGTRTRPEPTPIQIAPLPTPETPTITPQPPTPEVTTTLPVTPITPTPPIPIPTAPRYLATILPTTTLDPPAAGPGIADRTQTLTIRPADVAPGNIYNIKLLFSNGKSEYAFKESPAGSIIANHERRTGPHVITLLWKENTELEIATITIPRARPTLEIQWKSAAIVKRPDVVRLAYWLLQSSTIELDTRSANHQRLAFKPLEKSLILLTESSSPLTKGNEIPPDAAVTPPTVLPTGWQAAWYTEWDTKDASLKTPETASQVLKFHKPGTNAAIESWFLLTFRPGFSKVESTFARRLAADEADLAKAESDLRAINADIKRYKEEGGVKETDPILKPYLAKKEELTRLADAYKAAVAGYKQITEFEVPLTLPDGLPLTTLTVRARK